MRNRILRRRPPQGGTGCDAAAALHRRRLVGDEGGPRRSSPRGAIGVRAIAALAFVCCLLAGEMPARAAVTQNDLVIVARALSFMENPPSGTVRVGIVYSPGDPQSVSEAASVEKMLGDGLQSGTLVLRPVMVKIGDVANADVGLFFLTDGVDGAANKVAAAAGAKRIPCVTTDIAQVRNGVCVMGVRSQPRVEILVNRAAAEATGTAFSTAFRMLITEF